MSDDWRLRIDLSEGRRAFELARRLQAAELEHDLATGFPERVVVSRDESEVFCYTGSRDQADRARELIARLAAGEGWEVATELRRWHPVAEQWEDPDAPLPSTGTEREAEHAELIERERQETSETGVPDFEVRVQCRSHGDAVELSERLSADGIPSVRRWHYVVVGASDEDSARALADRIQAESPAGSVVTTEGTQHVVRATAPPNPFAIFGGLGA